jgi:hypothetical protein
MRNPVLDLPLSAVMRSEIALPLQHVLKVYTVGSFLSAWRSPKRQREMERLFDSPQQARHAATICAAWLGFETPPTTPQDVDLGWWRKDETARPAVA